MLKQRNWNSQLTIALQQFYQLPITGTVLGQSNYWIGGGFPMGVGWSFVPPRSACEDQLIYTIQKDLLQERYPDGLAGEHFWRSLANVLDVEYYGQIVDKLYELIQINPQSRSLQKNLKQYRQKYFDNYCPVCGCEVDGVLVGSSRLYECPICHEKWSCYLQ